MSGSGWRSAGIRRNVRLRAAAGDESPACHYNERRPGFDAVRDPMNSLSNP